MRLAVCLVLGAAVAGLAACGGGGGGAQTCTPGPTATLTVTDTGFQGGANNACVEPNGTVTFTNTGTAQHVIHFDTSGCVTGDAVTLLPQSSAPATFPNTQVLCNFHVDSSTAQSGTIAVSTQVQSGGGY
jgi:hypothetical protein